MCDQTEIPYRDGDVVWVKLGKCFWPGQVRDIDKLDEDIIESFKKKPIAAVQFFDEDKYEFVKNLEQISLYNGRKKMDFIKKGLDLCQKQKSSSTFMSKFPEDVKKAELLTGGNPNILSDPHFSPKEKTSYHALFDNNKSTKKEKAVTPRASISSSTNGRRSLPATPVRTPPRPITHPRFVRGETDHEVRIRDQQTSSSPATPGKTDTTATPTSKTNEPYKCQLCDFTSNRLNVIVLHNKFHSGDAANQNAGKGSANKSKVNKLKSSLTPSPVARPRGRPKGKTKVTFDEPKPVPKVTSTVSSASKVSSPSKAGTKRKILEVDSTGKTDEETVPVTKVKVKESPEKKVSKTSEKLVEKKSPKPAVLGKRKGLQITDKAIKKSKSDEKIREKLLADWDDEDAEEEELEVELLKKKPLKVINDTPGKATASCFDFDDSKDAILDNELEERAKKFVEGRKIPRLTDDKLERITVESDVDTINIEQPQSLPESSSLENNAAKTDVTANADDFDKAIDNLLEETTVPSLPLVPKISGILPDVVLDSNMTVVNNVKASQLPEAAVSEFSGVDHDYSAKQVVESEEMEYGDILDINSMPVVMTDDILSEEATTSQVSQMPKIDLIPSTTQTIVLSESEIKMPPSVKSLVKAVRTSTTDRSKTMSKNTVVSVKVGNKTSITSSVGNTMTIPTNKLTPLAKKSVISKGTAGGKYIIVQSPTGQQSRLTLAPHSTPDKPVASSSQHQMQGVSGGKVVILTKPQSQQKILTALTPAQQKTLTAGKLPSAQRIMTSSGQILTPVDPRTRIPVGKLTPITGQQMRVMTPTGKQTLVPKLTMQSLQTKVCLPSMQSIRQPAAGMRMVTTQKPQTSTIFIQAPQTLNSKPATSQLQTKTIISPNQMPIRPRLLKSPMTVIPSGKPIRVSGTHPKILQSRSTLQPRMIVQRARSPSVGVVAGMQPAHQVVGLTSQSQVIQKVNQQQTVMRIIPQPRKTIPSIQRVTVAQPKTMQLGPRLKSPAPKQSIPKAPIISTIPSPDTSSSNTIELLTSQSLPLLTPLQSTTSTSGNITLSMPQTSSLSLPNFQTSAIDTSGSPVLTADQLAQVMASTTTNQLGEAGATYVLLTIDDAGNLQHLNNQSLLSYDANDQSGQTFYIDSSSLETGGDLNNMILTIDNSNVQSNSGLAMNLVESNTNWIPSTSQDILAAALANTDVFQSEQDSLSCVVDTSSLLSSIPSTILLPSLNRVVSTAANVSETSLMLNQPIMSPLEVKSPGTSFRAPPMTTPHIPPPMYTPISEPLLIQPIMSTMEVSSNVVPPIVQSVFTTGGNDHSTSSEPLPAFHPSMPLLSEEPLESSALSESHEVEKSVEEEPAATSYEQLVFQDEEIHMSEPSHNDTNANTKPPLREKVDLGNLTDEFLESRHNEQIKIATTNSNDVHNVAYTSSIEEPGQSGVPLLESDLGSDMLQTFLPTNSSETLSENLDSNAIPHSMPLLSDDPVLDVNAESNASEIENKLDDGINQDLQGCGVSNEIELDQSEV